MDKFNKPKCGLVLLKSPRFHGIGEAAAEGTYDDRVEKKAKSLVSKLSGNFDTVYPGMVSSKQKVVEIIKSFVSEEVDFVIAAFMSWSEDFCWFRQLFL